MDGGQCSRRSRVIARDLLQHEAVVSRRALLSGLASVASVLALGGCAGVARRARGSMPPRFRRLPAAGRHHAQAGERRSRETLVRAGADSAMIVARAKLVAARRRPLLARRGRTWRLAPRRVEPVRETSAISSRRPAAEATC